MSLLRITIFLRGYPKNAETPFFCCLSTTIGAYWIEYQFIGQLSLEQTACEEMNYKQNENH